MIDEDGSVTQLVAEDRRAWHAGRSYWRGVTDINSASVGIELVNPGHEWGYRPFPDAQMEALLPLLAGIVRRWNIPRANVVAHSDIAPARKEDPGELFDWDLIAAHKLALARPRLRIPSPYENDGAFYLALERFGYDVADGHAAVRAFQRRWRPHIIDGVPDGECSAILFALLLDRDSGRAR
jgi:N-acetylmuramoyl-L-alanine amidase